MRLTRLYQGQARHVVPQVCRHGARRVSARARMQPGQGGPWVQPDQVPGASDGTIGGGSGGGGNNRGTDKSVTVSGGVGVDSGMGGLY